jgi:hypothetical protein
MYNVPKKIKWAHNCSLLMEPLMNIDENTKLNWKCDVVSQLKYYTAESAGWLK